MPSHLFRPTPPGLSTNPMNILQALASTPLTWTLTSSSRPYAPNPKHTEQTQLLTVIPVPGAAPLERHFRVDSELSLGDMMVLLMKKHLPEHPVLRQWQDTKGQVPVRSLLTDEDSLEGIGEPIHTALRKLSQSKASVITWNALHHMHSDDRVAVWTAAADVMRAAFAQGQQPLRQDLAMQLRDKLVSVAEQRRYGKPRDQDDREEERSEVETFALLMFVTGCEMTDLDEWTWDWLGWLVEDIADEQTLAA